MFGKRMRRKKMSAQCPLPSCIAAYGFLISERSRFSPQPAPATLDYASPRRHRASGREDLRLRPERHNQSAIDRDAANRHRALLAGLPSSPPVLRIAIRLIVGIDIDVDYAIYRSGVIRGRLLSTALYAVQ
jgi:hypothetical protein